MRNTSWIPSLSTLHEWLAILKAIWSVALYPGLWKHLCRYWFCIWASCCWALERSTIGVAITLFITFLLFSGSVCIMVWSLSKVIYMKCSWMCYVRSLWYRVFTWVGCSIVGYDGCGSVCIRCYFYTCELLKDVPDRHRTVPLALWLHRISCLRGEQLPLGALKCAIYFSHRKESSFIQIMVLKMQSILLKCQLQNN